MDLAARPQSKERMERRTAEAEKSGSEPSIDESFAPQVWGGSSERRTQRLGQRVRVKIARSGSAPATNLRYNLRSMGDNSRHCDHNSAISRAGRSEVNPQ